MGNKVELENVRSMCCIVPISKDVPVKGWLNIRFNCSGKSRIFLKGAPNPKVGVLTYYFTFFCQNCKKTKEFGRGGGGEVLLLSLGYANKLVCVL